jgi:hypothetical protein
MNFHSKKYGIEGAGLIVEKGSFEGSACDTGYWSLDAGI